MLNFFTTLTQQTYNAGVWVYDVACEAYNGTTYLQRMFFFGFMTLKILAIRTWRKWSLAMLWVPLQAGMEIAVMTGQILRKQMI